MSERILLIEDENPVRAGLKRLLTERYDVIDAADAESARRVLETQGPVPVVLCDHGLPGQSGLEFLNDVHQCWPETVGLLLTGIADREIAIAAVHRGHVHRFLSKPASYETLCEAIDDALAHHGELCERALGQDRLLFSKESLEVFHETLELRIADQSRSLERMQRFVLELNGAASLEEIVRLCATAASDLFGGRGTLVQLWGSQNTLIEASAGPEMSLDMHGEPMRTAEGQIGEIVVDLAGFEGGRIPDAERRLLASIASSTAVAAHNELRRCERDRAQHATILALARLSEQRDNETGKHLERVAGYCKLVASGLRADGKQLDRIDDAFIDDLVRSSPLHDIGKVGIPDSILLKPGKLTPEEWEIMKTHAEIGALTLAGVMHDTTDLGFLAMGRDIAWCHHEKWDGSGYPRGLRGDEIPLAARIVALADVYDALTTVRPYKSAWSHLDALAWIRERAGSHFDPDVVATFVRRAELADAVRGKLADTAEELVAKQGESTLRVR